MTLTRSLACALVPWTGFALLAAGCAKPLTEPAASVPSTSQGWQDLGLTRSYAEVDAIAEFGGALVAGGAFFDAAGSQRSSLLQWTGSEWSVLGGDTNGDVLALSVQDSRLVVGGSFTRVSGDSAGHIAAWDGAAWHTLGGGVDWHVFALAEYLGDLVAGGVFLHAGGTPSRLIARWDGTAWHALGSGVDDVVWALAVYRDELVAGGSFSTAGGTPAAWIAAWNGTSWRPLGSGHDLNGTVRALLAHHDTLYVGGAFTTAAGQPAQHVAIWTGSAWGSAGSGLGTYSNEGVHSFAVHDDRVVAGGSFSGGVAEWKQRLWSPIGFLPGDVTALGEHAGKLYAGGVFSPASESSPNGIARWVE